MPLANTATVPGIEVTADGRVATEPPMLTGRCQPAPGVNESCHSWPSAPRKKASTAPVARALAGDACALPPGMAERCTSR